MTHSSAPGAYRHIVLFQFKADAPAAKVRAIVEAFAALPAKLPQKNWRVRGPGGERNATMTMVAKPSLSVTTGELLDANAIEMMFEADVMRSTTLEGTPLEVNTNDAAASYREESVEKGGKKMRKHDNAAARNSSKKTQVTC